MNEGSEGGSVKAEMKLELGSWKLEIAAWVVVAALALLIGFSVWCATTNFQSLEMNASLKLVARDQKSAVRDQPGLEAHESREWKD